MNKQRLGLLAGLMLASLLVVGGLAHAQGAGLGLSWWTVDGGGGSLGQGGYALSGTVGQPDTGLLSNGGYVLAGGFWGLGSAGGTGGYRVYLPIVSKNH